MVDKSPLAPKVFPSMPVISGVRLAVGTTEIKYQGRNDMMIAQLVSDHRLRYRRQ